HGDHVAHETVFGIDAEDLNVPFLARAYGNALGEVDDGRGGNDAGDLHADRIQILDGEGVECGGGDVLRTALIFSPDYVGADRLDQVEHVLPAGHGNGDYQDQRGRADHHAQGGEGEADTVTAEGVVGKTQDFAQRHPGPGRGFADRGGLHAGFDAKR